MDTPSIPDNIREILLEMWNQNSHWKAAFFSFFLHSWMEIVSGSWVERELLHVFLPVLF